MAARSRDERVASAVASGKLPVDAFLIAVLLLATLVSAGGVPQVKDIPAPRRAATSTTTAPTT